MGHRGSKRIGRQLQEAVLPDTNLIIMAERELVAFAKAVGELFGPEQASLWAAEWIDQLQSMDLPAIPEASDLREITITVSSKLAHRNYPALRRRDKRE